jgi:hypothetical protein
VQIEARRASVIQPSRQSASAKSAALDARSRSVSQRFERVCARADVWRSELQVALVRCPDFHETIDNLHDWLGRITDELTSVEPVDVSASVSELRRKQTKLRLVKQQLDNAGPCVTVWHDTAQRLLHGIRSIDADRARNRLMHIAEKLRHLLRICGSQTELIDGALSDIRTHSAATTPRSVRPLSSRTSLLPATGRRLAAATESLLLRQPCLSADSTMHLYEHETDDDDLLGDGACHHLCCRQFSRICRTAAPLQLLMLLLLGAVWLLPLMQHCDDSYDCTVTNNLRQSLHPMLTYTDGMPPI